MGGFSGWISDLVDKAEYAGSRERVALQIEEFHAWSVAKGFAEGLETSILNVIIVEAQLPDGTILSNRARQNFAEFVCDRASLCEVWSDRRSLSYNKRSHLEV